jgi:hypothetical protein
VPSLFSFIAISPKSNRLLTSVLELKAMTTRLVISSGIAFGKQAVVGNRKMIQPTVDIHFAKSHFPGDPDMRHSYY